MKSNKHLAQTEDTFLVKMILCPVFCEYASPSEPPPHPVICFDELILSKSLALVISSLLFWEWILEM